MIFMMSSLQVEDPEFALTQLCLTSTRGELGKLPVDQLFKVEHGDFFSETFLFQWKHVSFMVFTLVESYTVS